MHKFDCKPNDQLTIKQSTLERLISSKKSILSQNYFNILVSGVIPSSKKSLGTLLSNINSTIQNQSSYLVQDVPISQLIQRDFIECFVKKGQLYVISHGTCLDTDNCIAVTPEGNLILHLTKDTYEELGLEGTPSRKSASDKTVYKYVVVIELTKPWFVVGKKNHARVVNCLDPNRCRLTFDLLVSWTPHDENICSSSVGVYFKQSGLNCHLVTSLKEWRERITQLCTFVPLVEFDDSIINACGKSKEASKRTQVASSLNFANSAGLISSSSDDLSAGCVPYGVFYEWLGTVCCQTDGCLDSYLSTYVCPEPHSEVEQNCTVWSAEGFITPSVVKNLLKINNEFLLKISNLPWIALNVHSFMDNPASNQRNENGLLPFCENNYTVVLFPDDRCCSIHSTSTGVIRT